MEVRGRVMGYTQMAFAASQVLGIPIGLLLANNYGWHSCFWMIAGFGSVVGVIMLIYLKPIDEHLKFRIDKNPFHHLFTTVSKPQYVFGFLTMSLLASGGFMLMPFGSAFGTHNLGLTLDQLPMLYLITGVFSILFGPLSGKLSDKIGKYRTFLAGTLIATIVVVIYTNLGITPFWIACLVSVLLFAGVTARMVSASALLTAIPAPEDRGAFMSVNSAIMQISGGVASVVAGRIVAQSKTGMIEHYNDLGYVVVGTMVVMAGMLYFINRSISQRKPVTFAPVPEAETGETDLPELAGEML
jgi:predicted MFS family arabinose efflux permease